MQSVMRSLICNVRMSSSMRDSSVVQVSELLSAMGQSLLDKGNNTGESKVKNGMKIGI